MGERKEKAKIKNFNLLNKKFTEKRKLLLLPHDLFSNIMMLQINLVKNDNSKLIWLPFSKLP